MTVCLLALGRERFEIYSEPPEDPVAVSSDADGWFRRWSLQASLRWNALVDMAREDKAEGRLARWRDAAVRHLAEHIAGQQTLWALRRERQATLLYPTTMTRGDARRALDRVLSAARRHHGIWLIVDLTYE